MTNSKANSAVPIQFVSMVIVIEDHVVHHADVSVSTYMKMKSVSPMSHISFVEIKIQRSPVKFHLHPSVNSHKISRVHSGIVVLNPPLPVLLQQE